MLIFWRLLLAHFIADFTLQTNKIAQWKRVSRWGMVVHVICHPVMYAIFVWPYLAQEWVNVFDVSLNGWSCIALITLLHGIEDQWRVWMIRRGAPDNTAFLFWDQAVHIAVLWAFAPRLIGMNPEAWVEASLGFVFLAHVTSVIIFFVENDLGYRSTVLEQSKYRYMAERLVGAGLFLLPSVGFLLGFAWIAWLMVRYHGTRTWAHLWIANTTVATIGLSLRIFIF
jgi:hypothetical protein